MESKKEFGEEEYRAVDFGTNLQEKEKVQTANGILIYTETDLDDQ